MVDFIELLGFSEQPFQFQSISSTMKCTDSVTTSLLTLESDRILSYIFKNNWWL